MTLSGRSGNQGRSGQARRRVGEIPRSRRSAIQTLMIDWVDPAATALQICADLFPDEAAPSKSGVIDQELLG